MTVTVTGDFITELDKKTNLRQQHEQNNKSTAESLSSKSVKSAKSEF